MSREVCYSPFSGQKPLQQHGPVASTLYTTLLGLGEGHWPLATETLAVPFIPFYSDPVLGEG